MATLCKFATLYLWLFIHGIVFYECRNGFSSLENYFLRVFAPGEELSSIDIGSKYNQPS